MNRDPAEVRREPAAAPARREPAPLPAAAIDDQLIDILQAPLAPGETASIGYRRKEQAILAIFSTLTVLESRALLARLRAERPGDQLVEKLGRLTAERRHRLLAFLADARRREALRLARR